MEWTPSELEEIFESKFTSVPGDPYDIHECRFQSSRVQYLLWVSPAREMVYLQFDDTSVPQASPLFESSILRCDHIVISAFASPKGFHSVNFAYTQGAPLSQKHLRLSIIKRATNGYGVCTYTHDNDPAMVMATEEESAAFLQAINSPSYPDL